MSLRRFAGPLAGVALILVGASAFAQTTLDDPLDARDARRVDRMEKVMRELRAIVFQGRDSGKPVVVQPAETDAQIQDLSRKIDDLQLTLTRLNGSLESVTHELDLTRRDRDALRADVKALSDRLSAVEQRASAAAPAEPADLAGAAPAAAPGPNSAEAFAAARGLMLSGDYDGAEAGFRSFIAAYGDSPKAPEARYWYGKTLTARGADSAAAGAYIGAIRGWPQTAWAPDAVVELSRALVALRKPDDACQTLAELTRRYPKVTAGVKARAAATAAQAKCA